MGLLAAVSAAISGTQTNITSVNYDHHESETATMVFLLEVRDREHLAQVVHEVRRMSAVLRVVRTIAGQSHRKDAPPPRAPSSRPATRPRRSAPIRRPCARATLFMSRGRYRSIRPPASW